MDTNGFRSYQTALVLCAIITLGGCGTDKKKQQSTKEESVAQEMIKLPSGLTYMVITPAPKNAVGPSAGQRVAVHYTGWLDNNGLPGKQFDSSVDRNEAFVFTIGVGQVIRGWDEGVLGMKVGEKRRLYIPAHLGYGNQEIPSLIPRNSNLIFDVELLGVG